MCFYHGPHEEFKDLFLQEDGVVFCNDVCSVIEVLGHEFKKVQFHLYNLEQNRDPIYRIA